MRVVARDVVVRHEAAVAVCSYWEVAQSAAREAGVAKLGRFIGHAGGAETAMMMALAPALVRTDRLPAENPDPPRLSERGVAPGLIVHKSGEWERVGGYSDASAHATAEWGNRLLDIIEKTASDAIVAFHRAAY